MRTGWRRTGSRCTWCPYERRGRMGTLRKIRQMKESWSELAPGQIIAQPNLRPIVSQGGYHLEGSKQALIWTNSQKLRGSFQVVDVEEDEVVYEGVLRDVGDHIWGGNTLVADFSDLKTPGRYRIRPRVEGTESLLDSFTFPIGPSLYLDLAERGARWFYYQRCGTEVPGWHPPCHTDDAILDGKSYDATGGWHDGGDYNKWSHYSYYGLFALLELYEAFPDRWEVDGLPYPLEEAVWEAEYVRKVQLEDGVLLSAVGGREDPWFWEGAPEKEPTRRLSADYGGRGYGNTTLVGAAMARLARVLRSLGYDEDKVQEYIKVAERGYRRGYNADFSEVPDGDKGSYLDTQAGLLLADIEFEGLTGDEGYRVDARRRVEAILSAQDERGFFYSDYEGTRPCRGRGFHLFALYKFLSTYPEDPLGPKIVDAFARWAEFWEPFARLSHFGQMGGPDRDGRPRNLPLWTCNIHIARAGWAMATAAMLLDRRDYLEIAERQIHWIVGYNPLEVSMMAGLGRGPGCYHTRLASCEGHEDGVVPGGILNGIEGSDGGVVELGDRRTGNLVIGDHLPLDYPLMDMDTYGWTYAYLTNEYWVPNNGWFVLAAVQLERAVASRYSDATRGCF